MTEERALRADDQLQEKMIRASAGVLLISAAVFAQLQNSPAQDGNFLCNRYVPWCTAFLDAVACPPLDRSIFGCGGPGVNGTLASDFSPPNDDNDASNPGWHCSCTAAPQFNTPSEPSGPSERLHELLWDTAVAGGGGVTLVAAATSRVDMNATFGALCTETLSGLGCPPGQQTIVTNQATGGDGAYHCACGAFDQGSQRAIENVIDKLASNFTNYTFSDNFLCDNYNKLCNHVLSGMGCNGAHDSGSATKNGRWVDGCRASAHTLENYAGHCTCNAPFFTDVADDRIAELLFDRFAKPAIDALSPPVSAAPGGMASFLDSYRSVCNVSQEAVGCPAGVLIISADAASPPYACTCGQFDIPDERVTELLIDKTMENYTAAAKADYIAHAAPVPPLAPPAAASAAVSPATTGLIAAVAVLSLALFAVGAFVLAPAALSWWRSPARSMTRKQRIERAKSFVETANPAGGIALAPMSPQAAPERHV